ncbi:MAG: BatD family protein [Endomicrobia bacterium]|nr:BatD family protein [Endomicrobiia bacterium]
MRNKCFKIIFLFLLITTKLYSEISISASVDKNTIALNEQIVLQVSVSGDTTNIPQPKIPTLPDFQIYSSGRSQSISIVNGQVSSSVNFNYILVPKRVGEFEIPPITVEYKGKIFQTEPIKIKVEKQSPSAQQQIPLQKNVYTGQQRNIFVETVVDKKTAYVNEQITLTFRFFTRINLVSQPQYIPPETTGFLTEDLPPQRNYYTTIDGHRYYVSEIKTALFPTTAGKFTIGAATVKCMIEDFDIDDFFSDSFFRRFFSQGKEIILKSQPIEINVINLPEPKPNEFLGSVGKYSIAATIDKQKLEQNETTFLNIKISGVGNIKSVSLPKSYLEKCLGNNFVIYEPITSYDTQKENYIVKGSKTFKIPISIVTPGSITIPEIKFVYFNPQTKQYEAVSTKPLVIEVTPSSKQTTKLPEKKFYSQQQKIEFEDIRYIKTKMSVKNVKKLQNFFYLGIQLIPFLGWLGFTLSKINKEIRLKDIKKYRAKRALKYTKKMLKNVKFDEKFFHQIYDIVVTYLADKLYISKEAVTTEIIKRNLQYKISEPVYKELLSLWEELNFYKYAPTKIKEIQYKDWTAKILLVLEKLEYELQKI